MTIVVSGISNKALMKLTKMAADTGTSEMIDFSAGYFNDDEILKVDTFLKDSEWKVITCKCAGKEIVEIRNMVKERFVMVLTTGEFDSVTIV